MQGRDEEALAQAREAQANTPNAPSALRLAASSLGRLGRNREAREILARLEAAAPGVKIASRRAALQFAFREDEDRHCEGLRRAGMPE